jgi:hypothetical protein
MIDPTLLNRLNRLLAMTGASGTFITLALRSGRIVEREALRRAMPFRVSSV